MRGGGAVSVRPHASLAPGAYVIAEDTTRKALSTAIICIGALFTMFTASDRLAEVDTYRYGAYAMGITMLAAFLVEASGGVRSMIRVDIVALFGLYFLTFAEFLHPNVRVLYNNYTGSADFSCQITAIAFAGLAIGRHFAMPLSMGVGKVRLPDLPPRRLFIFLIVLFVLGFLWVFISVRLNPVTLFSALLAERFNRPWSRGSVGNWLSFLTELNLLLYPAAALGGYIFARGKEFTTIQRVATGLMVGFMFVFDIGDGARNTLLIRAGLFVCCYFIANREAKSTRIIVLTVIAAIALWLVSWLMLEFRSQGLGNFLASGQEQFADNADGTSSFMLDNNLVSIARVAQQFPDIYPYPGFEVISQIFTKWIPRAVWPGKPLDFNDSLGDVFQTQGAYTVALTFVGEAYLIAGVPSVVIVSFLLGSLASTWTKVGLAARTNLELIYYSTGFFVAMLGMRSVQFISIAVVPTVAFYFAARWLGRKNKQQPGYAP